MRSIWSVPRVPRSAARAAAAGRTWRKPAGRAGRRRTRHCKRCARQSPPEQRMTPLDSIREVETWVVSLPRDVPYLGPLREGETVNPRGYIVRRGNGTIYPTKDTTVLVRVTGESGMVGWGETYGIVAGQATKAIIDDVLAPVMIGRDPGAPVPLHEDL